MNEVQAGLLGANYKASCAQRKLASYKFQTRILEFPIFIFI